ncbi:MAG: DUF2917 domain-containing protein [Acidobacteria bacterium]|nr:DUF2917 domain-containing protein [Acidobacteriota bacterium]
MLNLIDDRQISKWHMETDQFGLKKDELWKSPDKFHLLSINCKQGTVWITQTGDEEDHLLESGEVFETLEEGLVVMQSLSDNACVEILRN